MSAPKRVPVLFSKHYRSPGNGEFTSGMVAGFEEEEARRLVESGIALPYLSPEEAALKAAHEREEAEFYQRQRDEAARAEEEAAAIEARKAEEAKAAAPTPPGPVAHAESPEVVTPPEAITITMSGEGTAHPPETKKKKGKA